MGEVAIIDALEVEIKDGGWPVGPGADVPDPDSAEHQPGRVPHLRPVDLSARTEGGGADDYASLAAKIQGLPAATIGQESTDNASAA